MGKIENRLWLPLKVKRMNVHKKFSFMLILISCLFCISCNSRHYVGQHFYFPQGSNPDKLDWKYHGYVHMSLAGNWFELNEKSIEISISNPQGKEVVLDSFDLVARGLKVETIWENENMLIVNFIEVGDLNFGGKSNSQNTLGKSIKTSHYDLRKIFK